MGSPARQRRMTGSLVRRKIRRCFYSILLLVLFTPTNNTLVQLAMRFSTFLASPEYSTEVESCFAFFFPRCSLRDGVHQALVVQSETQGYYTE